MSVYKAVIRFTNRNTGEKLFLRMNKDIATTLVKSKGNATQFYIGNEYGITYNYNSASSEIMVAMRKAYSEHPKKLGRTTYIGQIEIVGTLARHIMWEDKTLGIKKMFSQMPFKEDCNFEVFKTAENNVLELQVTKKISTGHKISITYYPATLDYEFRVQSNKDDKYEGATVTTDSKHNLRTTEVIENFVKKSSKILEEIKKEMK